MTLSHQGASVFWSALMIKEDAVKGMPPCLMLTGVRVCLCLTVCIGFDRFERSRSS